MTEYDEDRRPWRGWHRIARFLPMVFLGGLFVFLGLGPLAGRGGRIDYGILFVWVGVVLILAAVVGMVFTRCPDCYQTRWVFCVQEPDVHPVPSEQGYYRELSTTEEMP